MASSASEQLEQLRDHLGSRYSPDSIRTFISQARHFIAHTGAKGAYSHEDLTSYINYLVSAGYQRRSIRTAIASLRAFLSALGQEWPLAKRDTYLGVSAEEQGGPTLEEGAVAQLIAAAQHETPFYRAVVALSTTYGLRPVELAATLKAGLNGQTLVVPTSKGGRVRSHAIPESLSDILRLPPTTTTRGNLQHAYQHLMSTYARPPKSQEGWHAVRRALVTGLFGRGVAVYDVYRWMGWRLNETPYHYYHPDITSLDNIIYNHHPFLILWQN